MGILAFRVLKNQVETQSAEFGERDSVRHCRTEPNVRKCQLYDNIRHCLAVVVGLVEKAFLSGTSCQSIWYSHVPINCLLLATQGIGVNCTRVRLPQP